MIFGRNRAGGEAPGGASDDAAGRGHRHGHAHAHAHAHAPAGDRFDARLLATTALNAVVTVAEIVGGIAAGSLALLADALHNLSDVAALALALVARRLGRRPPTARFTYGFKRVEAMAALINGLALLVVSGFIAVEALKRLQAPEPPHATAMFLVALVALAGHGFSVLLLRGHDHAPALLDQPHDFF
ncbi:MAG TPA: cation diffusion facilitator family transporter, partial [Acidobacteriota bacterium]|nr:cation diffusion facilitator family transporter [Acidobacteriota bacterium]